MLIRAKHIISGALLFMCLTTVLTQSSKLRAPTTSASKPSTTEPNTTTTVVKASPSASTNKTGNEASTTVNGKTTTTNPVKQTITVVNPQPEKNGSSPSTVPPSNGSASPTNTTVKAKTSPTDKTSTANPVKSTSASVTNTGTPAPKAQGSGSNTTNAPKTTQKPTPQPAVTSGSQTPANKTGSVTPKPGAAPTTTTTQKPGTVSPSNTTPKAGKVSPNTTTTTSTPKPIPTVTVATSVVNTTNTTKPNSTAAPSKANSTISTKPSTTPAATPKSTTTVSTAKVNVTGSTKSSTGVPSPPSKSPNITSTKAPDIKTNPTNQTSTGGPVTKPTNTSGATTQQPVATTNTTGGSDASSTAAPVTSSKGPSTPAPSHDKVYINEIMVDKNGGFQTIELLIPGTAKLDHYAMVLIDGGTLKRQVYNLKVDGKQKNNVLTIPINSTLHVMKDRGTGIAVYDTNMVNVTQPNWKADSVGLMDALVIGKTYQVSGNLSEMISEGDYPFVIDPTLYGKLKTISRCSRDSLMSADMFILTDASLGETNTDKCEAKMSKRKMLVLKIDAKCSTIDQDTARNIMNYVVREVNKDCHCGITRQHVKDIQVSCCQETLLKIQFVIPSDSNDKHLENSYKTFIDTAPSIQMGQKSYLTDKNCDDYKACCQQYKCCAQPKPLTQDNTTKNVRITVAAVVSCLLIFMIIVVLVIIYMKRKKTVNYQFRMSRLREDDDDDLMMEHADVDDFVGGQEATFDVKA